MPSFSDVGDYLEANRLEQTLSDVVAECVEDERPQPLAAIADRLYERAAEFAVDWDYASLTADVRKLVMREQCGPLFVRLAFADAATYSAELGDGGPNAALRFIDKGEGTFGCNAGLASRAAPLLEPIKARYPAISRADLWAHAANVAIEAMGGPVIHTRFGRRDAASSAESAASPAGRLPDDLANVSGLSPSDGKADHLRELFAAKGFGEREIVALLGRHTVGEYEPPDSGPGGGPWTTSPQRFDNAYFGELLSQRYEVAAAGAAGLLFRCEASATLLLPTDHALLRDPRLRVHAERYASDQPAFFAEFAAAWTKLLELGCGRLAPHPSSLTYASECVIPCEWLELPLRTRKEHNHDTTVYGFELRKGQQLRLPACACLLVRAPGKGRDGRDAVRAYFPTSDPSMSGRFELIVRRSYEGEGEAAAAAADVVAQWLHALPLGGRVSFKHPALCLKEQYPFEGKQQLNMIAGGMGIAPMFQILWKVLFTPGDDRKVVLLYASRSINDILLRAELEEWAKELPHRLTLVHVVGGKASSSKATDHPADHPADDAPPRDSWKTTEAYVAETGAIDRAKVAKYAFKPSKGTLCFVCGPTALYTTLCGPREERSLREGTILDELGYTPGQVAKL